MCSEKKGRMLTKIRVHYDKRKCIQCVTTVHPCAACITHTVCIVQFPETVFKNVRKSMSYVLR